MKFAQVLVEPAQERHPRDPVESRLARGRVGGHADHARARPRPRDDRLVAEVDPAHGT